MPKSYFFFDSEQKQGDQKPFSSQSRALGFTQASSARPRHSTCNKFTSMFIMFLLASANMTKVSARSFKPDESKSQNSKLPMDLVQTVTILPTIMGIDVPAQSDYSFGSNAHFEFQYDTWTVRGKGMWASGNPQYKYPNSESLKDLNWYIANGNTFKQEDKDDERTILDLVKYTGTLVSVKFEDNVDRPYLPPGSDSEENFNKRKQQREYASYGISALHLILKSMACDQMPSDDIGNINVILNKKDTIVNYFLGKSLLSEEAQKSIRNALKTEDQRELGEQIKSSKEYVIKCR